MHISFANLTNQQPEKHGLRRANKQPEKHGLCRILATEALVCMHQALSITSVD